MAERNGIQKTTRAEAEPLTEEDLQEHIQQLEEVDSTEVWNAFLASSYDLFKFILRYDYKVKCTMEDLVTLFCQLVILHSDECRMTRRICNLSRHRISHNLCEIILKEYTNG